MTKVDPASLLVIFDAGTYLGGKSAPEMSDETRQAYMGDDDK